VRDTGTTPSRQPGGRILAATLIALCAAAAPRLASAEGLSLAARVPVAAPFGYTSHGGAGFAPSLNLQLGSHLAVGVTSGILWYNDGDRWEKEIPVLVGATFLLRDRDSWRPYLELRAGYTYAIDTAKSPHWLTVMAGVGALVPVSRTFALDLGFDVIAPDLRGNARDPVGLLLKVGVVHQLM
jgi:hypothetical protein